MFYFSLHPNMAKIKIEQAVIESDLNAETKLKLAARKLFAKQGFAGTTTRDIAKEAGLNLALLNYYFRSKERLFELVMFESMQQFLKGIAGILNKEELSLEQKLEQMASIYTQLFLDQPDLPLFVLSEIRKDPKQFEAHLGVKKIMMGSHFMKQLKQVAPKKINPFHFLINTIGLCVFPFMAAPMLQIVGDLDVESYQKLLKEREKLIPFWIKMQLESTI